MNFINIFGLIMGLGLLIPNGKWPLAGLFEGRGFWYWVRMIGYGGSLFLMGFNLGFLELDSQPTTGALAVNYVELFWIWVVLGLLLTAGYCVLYRFALKKDTPVKRGALVGISFLLFFFSALLRGHILQFPFAFFWLLGHIPLLFGQKQETASPEEALPSSADSPEEPDHNEEEKGE